MLSNVFFTWSIQRCLNRSRVFLENLGTAISAEARKILPSLLKNFAVNSQN